ncbi:MAG: SIMPL domain-containing protein [Patescibacteria group bacterium]
MKKIHVFLVTLGVLAVSAIVIVALVMANRVNNQDRFSVTGSGTIYAKADIANLQVGLKTDTKKTAAEATKDGSDKMNEVIKAIIDLGVEEKDIKTSGYSLNPVYNWTNDRGQELIGYEVSQNVSLKIRDLEKIGEIIAKTTEKGANQIGGINFTIDDEYELRNQARELAIEKAKEKAGLIAGQSGMKLGKIKSVYENYDSPQPVYYSNAKMEAVGMGGSDMAITSPEIQSGQNEIKVEVTLVYEVK